MLNSKNGSLIFNFNFILEVSMSGLASISLTIDSKASLNLENVQPLPKDNPQLKKALLSYSLIEELI